MRKTLTKHRMARWSHARLQVGPQDFLHTADAGELKDLLKLGATPFAIDLEGFQRYVQANLVAKLEAVSQGLFGAIDSDQHTIHRMCFNPNGKRLLGEAEHVEGWVLRRDSNSASRDSNNQPARTSAAITASKQMTNDLDLKQIGNLATASVRRRSLPPPRASTNRSHSNPMQPDHASICVNATN